MRYLSCPTAVINAPVDVVWALLVDPAGWEHVFDMRVAGIDPPGPAVVGQKVCGETGPRIFHLKLTLRMMEIDPDYHRLRLDVNFPLGLTVEEDLRCTPLDDIHCRVDYRCNFDFPRGWRGTLIRVLMNRRLVDGPKDSRHALSAQPNGALQAERMAAANGRKPRRTWFRPCRGTASMCKPAG